MSLWAILPGLPLRLWTKEALVEICNKLGVFLGKNQIGNPRLTKDGSIFKFKGMYVMYS
jgi:hypothetical protein